MTFSDASLIIGRISYKPNWNLCLKEVTDTIWLLSASFITVDSVDARPTSLETRYWLVDPTFSEYDIVYTAFLCLEEAENHEIKEFFKVDGVSIFNPHITMSARKEAVRASFGPDTLAHMGF